MSVPRFESVFSRILVLVCNPLPHVTAGVECLKRTADNSTSFITRQTFSLSNTNIALLGLLYKYMYYI